MKVTLTFKSASDVRVVTYYLRRRYKSKARLEKLAMVAIRGEVANEAKKELSEVESKS